MSGVEFRLKTVELDGELVVKLWCRGCKAWGQIDNDQLCGRVSVHCDASDGGCGFHETHDFRPFLIPEGV